MKHCQLSNWGVIDDHIQGRARVELSKQIVVDVVEVSVLAAPSFITKLEIVTAGQERTFVIGSSGGYVYGFRRIQIGIRGRTFFDGESQILDIDIFRGDTPLI